MEASAVDRSLFDSANSQLWKCSVSLERSFVVIGAFP